MLCRFWRQNIMKFEEKDFEVQKALVKLLKESLYAFRFPKGFFLSILLGFFFSSKGGTFLNVGRLVSGTIAGQRIGRRRLRLRATIWARLRGCTRGAARS